MVVCFDTSAINNLMDDPECERLTSILLREFDVHVTGLNIVEIGKTTSPDRREQLRAFEKRLAKNFEPLDLPNELVKRACTVFDSGAKEILVTLGPDSRSLWIAMSKSNSVDDNACVALKQWAKELESSTANVNALARSRGETIFKSNSRPRTPKQLLRIVQTQVRKNRQDLYNIVAGIYEHATNKALPFEQFESFMAMKPSIWALYLNAEVYLAFYRAVWRKEDGERNQASKLDLWAAVYLPFCDVFVTHDTKRGGQFSALRLLNAFSSRRPRARVMRWSKFRDALEKIGREE